jgi:outer membrane biosynthesis protein TonB
MAYQVMTGRIIGRTEELALLRSLGARLLDAEVKALAQRARL